MIGHAKECLWATPLPTGWPNFWHCTCGYSQWELEHEDDEAAQLQAEPELANICPACKGDATMILPDGKLMCLCGYVGQAKTSQSG